MSNALYRKYRPQKFSEIIGQSHIVQTLSNAIKRDHIGHAYLFTGPRGTGKTTIARIFAKAVNCEDRKDFEPCGKCPNCQNISDSRSLDIIEIDAASNTGVDNIRELKKTVNLPPTSSKYKVYIIDEAHMLSTGAFNALLKTLEEPPAHAIFILATTVIHKIPETIVSRCQRFDFSRFPLENIIKKISAIAKSEKVKIEKEALEMIAIAAEGGMRDAESILTQIISLEDKEITAKEVEEILGTTDRQALEELGALLFQENTISAISRINQLSEEGYDLEIFSKSFLNYLRQLMLVSIDQKLAENFSLELTQEQINSLVSMAKKSNTEKILRTIEFFSEAKEKIKSAFIPQLPLEMAIIKSMQNPQAISKNIQPDNSPNSYGDKISNSHPPDGGPISKQIPNSNEQNSKQIRNLELEDMAEKTKKEKTAVEYNEDIMQKTEKTKLNNVTIDEIKSKWNKFLEEIKPFNHSLNAVLYSSVPVEIKGDVLVIATKYGFHRERINEPQSKLTITEIFDKIFGTKIKIQCVSEEEAGIKIESKIKNNESGNSNSNDPLISEALNIFGGKIVE